MIDWLKHLKERWDNWSGDSELDRAIRDHLCDLGYFGSTAKIQSVRLVAVQRPGWLQIFRFEASARLNLEVDDEHPDPEATYHLLFGLVREDHRKNQCDIQCFQNESERHELFAQWSNNLICLRGAKGLGQH